MEIDVLKKKLQPLFREHKIEKAILFGSHARDEASRHSDIDLILIYTPEELAAISDRHFIKQALKEGKILFERA